jgi:Cys-tRNA(Pro) deacylase
MGMEKLEEYLRKKGITAVITDYGQPVQTVGQASQVSGVPPERIVKSLVLVDDRGQACICLVPGNRRLSMTKAIRALQVGRLRFANDEEVLRATGYEAGAVPPLGHLRRLKVLVDERVLKGKTIVAGGGSSSALVEISPEEVLRATGAKVADISS